MGWDQQFHLNRISELKYALGHHQLIPYNGLHSFLNIGLPVNMFYPFTFLYPFAAMQFLFSPIHAWYLTMMLYTFISFVISYVSIVKLDKSKLQAYLFSILYNTSGYMVLQFTKRADIGEYIALILLPLAFLGLKKIKENGNTWLLLPLGMGLIANAHILSVIILSTALLLEVAGNYKSYLNTKKKIIRFFISAGLFVLLTAPIIYSVFSMKLNNTIVDPQAPGPLQTQGLNFSNLLYQSFSNSTPTPLADVNLGIVSLILFFICLLNFKKLNLSSRKYLICALVLVFISTNIFPWFIIQHTPLTVIQFPWRFLGPATFYISLSFITGLPKISLNNKFWVIIILVLSVCTTLTYTHSYVSSFRNNNQIATTQNFEYVSQTAAYSDYMPKNAFANSKDILAHVAIVNGKKVHLSSNDYKISKNSISIKVNGLKKKPNTIDLPILHFLYDKKYAKSARDTIQYKVAPSKTSYTVTYRQRTASATKPLFLLSTLTFLIIFGMTAQQALAATPDTMETSGEIQTEHDHY